jgi:hypothetical protein
MKAPLILSGILLIGLTARSQHVKPKPLSATDREKIFMASASALPRLYEKRDFDSIAYYVQQRWKQGPTDPDLLCQAVLLSIQRHIFYLTDFSGFDNLSWPLINELDAYADALAGALGPYPSDYHARPGFDVGAVDKQLFGATSRWAYDLLVNNDLDSVQAFLCRVFDGEIRYPEDYLFKIPQYKGLFGGRNREVALPRLGAVLSVSGGAWLPTGNLSALGVHPSVSYEFGARNWWNEYDLDASLRFVSTPHPYVILRNDTLMSRNFYEGGDLVLNYCRYLIHRPRHEFGVSAGVGVDFIDFANDANDVDWSPTEIVSVDLNLGLRYNYHFGKHGFVGLVARYHYLDHRNPGGTPFDGNGFTIDVVVGGNGSYRH